MKPIKSPNMRTYPISAEKLEKGRFLAYQTHAWMEAHEYDFKLILDYVRELQAQGYKGRVREKVADFCYHHKISIGAGNTYTFNNNYWAGISRYLVLVDPTLKNNPIRFRASDIDCYGLMPVSYLEGKI